METSSWEFERFIYEILKQSPIFRYWKKEQFKCQVGKCAWCGKPMEYRYTETDHIVPLFKGGRSYSDNLVLCHHFCNKKKGTSASFKRPTWIQENKYGIGLNKRYEFLVEDNKINQPTIEPKATRSSAERIQRRMAQIEPSRSNKNSSLKNQIKKEFKNLLVGLFEIAAGLLMVLLTLKILWH